MVSRLGGASYKNATSRPQFYPSYNRCFVGHDDHPQTINALPTLILYALTVFCTLARYCYNQILQSAPQGRCTKTRHCPMNLIEHSAHMACQQTQEQCRDDGPTFSGDVWVHSVPGTAWILLEKDVVPNLRASSRNSPPISRGMTNKGGLSLRR